MRKWFSFNPKTQRVEELPKVTEDLFTTASELLYWSRGLDGWVKLAELSVFYQGLSEDDRNNPPPPAQKPVEASKPKRKY